MKKEFIISLFKVKEDGSVSLLVPVEVCDCDEVRSLFVDEDEEFDLFLKSGSKQFCRYGQCGNDTIVSLVVKPLSFNKYETIKNQMLKKVMNKGF